MIVMFIHSIASSNHTIYTPITFAAKEAEKSYETFFVTFDQPLLLKAHNITASHAISYVVQMINRLSGFHRLTSFLDCIGYIMSGSGIKDFLSIIYAPSTIDHMMNGHAYAREIRSHILLRLAIYQIIASEIQEFREENINVRNEEMIHYHCQITLKNT